MADNTYHAIEEPTSLNTLELLPELKQCNIKAVKIEGRQRSPAYIAQVTKVWRQALDAVNQTNYQVEQAWQQSLANLSEGKQTTLGALHKSWQ